MKCSTTLVLLLEFLAFTAFAEENNTIDFIPINVLNITMRNSSLMYPDVLVLLPHHFSAEQTAEFMDQLAVGMDGASIESPDNALTLDTDADVTRGADAALLEAARQISSLNATSANLSAVLVDPNTDNSTSHQIYAVIPTVEDEYIRKRRSLERLAPLSREKRTLKKMSKHSCSICDLLQPKQPIVINVYKQGGGCGRGCGQQHYQPPSCGQPQCGYHPQPQPPPPVYHPPPQQTCDPCNNRPSYQQQQPAYHQPASNSYSYSQSSSSAGSYNWGKKK